MLAVRTRTRTEREKATSPAASEIANIRHRVGYLLNTLCYAYRRVFVFILKPPHRFFQAETAISVVDNNYNTRSSTHAQVEFSDISDMIPSVDNYRNLLHSKKYGCDEI